MTNRALLRPSKIHIQMYSPRYCQTWYTKVLPFCLPSAWQLQGLIKKTYPTFLLLVASSSHCLGLWCVCGLSDLGRLDVLDWGGSFSSSFSGLFLSLVFGGLFGIILCCFFFLLLLCVFLVGALAVGNLFLNRLALLVRWLGACLLVSNGTIPSIIVYVGGMGNSSSVSWSCAVL